MCTLSFKKHGFEKSRSVSNLRKIPGPAHLIFFQFINCFFFFSDLYHKPEKKSGDKLKKKSGVQELKGLKQTLINQDLNFQKSRCRINGCKYVEELV